jgi:hypothetical protein
MEMKRRLSPALGFFIFIVAPVRESAKNPTDNPGGMFTTALVSFLFLAWTSGRRRPPTTS